MSHIRATIELDLPLAPSANGDDARKQLDALLAPLNAGIVVTKSIIVTVTATLSPDQADSVKQALAQDGTLDAATLAVVEALVDKATS